MSDYSLASTTRFDPFLLSLDWNNDENDSPSPFFLIALHLARLRDAADKHGWTHASLALSPHSIHAACQQAVSDTSTAFKIRLLLSQAGELSAIAMPIPSFTADPTSAPSFKPDSGDPSLYGPIITVHIDTQPTQPSLFTSTKTTRRDHYLNARSRAGISPTDISSDVLLYNPDDLITESSVCNVAFYCAPFWLTPPTSTGCLPGVVRRWLLQQGRIREAEDNLMTKSSIKDGDWVLLFNGVQGCRLGRVSL